MKWIKKDKILMENMRAILSHQSREQKRTIKD